MNTDRGRYLRTVALGLAVLALSAACGSDSPPSGRSSGTPTPPVSVSVAATTSPARSATPTGPVTSSPGLTSACLGPVVYTISGSSASPYPRSLCFAAGGVLRIENIGPGLVTADPPSLASIEWEAGIANCRFVNPGTVTIKLALETGARSITVVVVR